ncbi:MAG: pyrimidine 5'-nucleotidase [Hyphomicrobiales bacterium]
MSDVDLTPFCDVDTWIFDLDNTLYPRSCDLFAQMNVRMTQFIQDLKGLPFDEARIMQKKHYHDYGTTLRGLMKVENINPEDYLNFVHDIDYSPVKPAPDLRAAIDALPGRKMIFTNGDVPHAKRTTDKLGITDLFEHVFDIIAADLVPKPHRDPYEKFIKLANIDPTHAAMFEDLPRNLAVPHEMKMRTVLIQDPPDSTESRQPWEVEITNADHVHFQTSDLTGFLQEVGRQFYSP